MTTSSTTEKPEKVTIDIDELLFYKLEKLSKINKDAGLPSLFFTEGDTTPTFILS